MKVRHVITTSEEGIYRLHIFQTHIIIWGGEGESKFKEEWGSVSHLKHITFLAQ